MKTFAVRFLLFAFSLSITLIADSQTEWESLNGPFGGTIDILVQSENLTLFAGTRKGLFRRTIDKSEWSFVSELGDADISALVAGKEDRELYLANGSDYLVYRSQDDGGTWSALPLENEMGFDHITVSSRGALILAEGNSIWVSRDRGQTAMKVMLPGDVRILNLAASEAGWLMAGTNRGLYFSENDGGQWSEFKKGLPTSLFVSQLVMDQIGRTVLSTIENRVYRLEPTDTAFKEFITGWEDIDVTSLSIDTSFGVLVGTRDGAVHILDTTGASTALPGSKLNVNRRVLELLFGRQGKVYIARSSSGVEAYDPTCNCTETINMGLTASQIHAILTTSDRKLIVSTRNKLFLHNKEDKTWKEITLVDRSIDARCLMQASDGKIYAGGADGVLELNLGNEFATADSIGPFGFSISFLAEDNQNRLVAGSASDGLFVREKDDLIWMDFRTTEMQAAVLTDMHVAKDSSIYISYHQGIFKSQDNGESWHTALEGVPQVGSIGTDMNGNVFGTSFPGVVKSTDGGDQWEHVKVGDNSPITSLLTANTSSLYAGSMEGIFRSQDDGESWEVFTQGLGVKSTGSIKQDWEGNIYAGTNGGGVYRLEGQVSTVKNQGTTTFGLSISPNPAIGSVDLWTSMELTRVIEISLYSADFRMLFKEKKFVSKNERPTVDLSNFLPGLYFVSITTETENAIGRLIKM